MTDEEIVALTLTDKNQFGVLVERYEAKLTRYLRRLGVIMVDDQLDVLQEIFIKTYRNLNDFDTSLSFSSWIYRIAHNEAMSWHRRERARPTGHLIADGEEVIDWTPSGEVSAEDTYALTQDKERLNKALGLLPEKYRNPLILRYFEHKEYDEISDILRIPVGTVGTLIHRGKKLLETHLAKTP